MASCLQGGTVALNEALFVLSLGIQYCFWLHFEVGRSMVGRHHRRDLSEISDEMNANEVAKAKKDCTRGAQASWILLRSIARQSQSTTLRGHSSS
eukprot:scaffold2914_cov74-Skeletonema_menzelii.AAC.1